MDIDAFQPSHPPTSQDLARRIACIRCRTQKLKCLKSTQAEPSSRCDRCRKANTECTYAASKPMGRPKTSPSRHSNHALRSPTSQSHESVSSDRFEILREANGFNTLIDNPNPNLALDSHNINVLLGQIEPFGQSDASTSQDLGLTVSDFEFLTPCSSHGSLPFPNDLDSYMTAAPIESDHPGPHVATAADPCTPEKDTTYSMQHLAEIALELFSQIRKHQRAGDDVLLADLVSDVLHSSTAYLNTLLSLDATFVSSRSNVEPDWANEHAEQPPQLDMSAAFQLLIPYVRLVQLHNFLYRAILRSTRSAPTDTPTRVAFPDIHVGGVYINAGDPLRARLLLQLSVHLLAEIEAILELPHEARICCSEGDAGAAVNEQGTYGLLRKAVSPRLLKTILDERNLGGNDVQSMRDRIAYIKRLLRCTSFRR